MVWALNTLQKQAFWPEFRGQSDSKETESVKNKAQNS